MTVVCLIPPHPFFLFPPIETEHPFLVLCDLRAKAPFSASPQGFGHGDENFLRMANPDIDWSTFELGWRTGNQGGEVKPNASNNPPLQIHTGFENTLSTSKRSKRRRRNKKSENSKDLNSTQDVLLSSNTPQTQNKKDKKEGPSKDLSSITDAPNSSSFPSNKSPSTSNTRTSTSTEHDKTHEFELSEPPQYHLDKKILRDALNQLGVSKICVDLFASRNNHQVPRYFSRKPEPSALGTNALEHSWSALSSNLEDALRQSSMGAHPSNAREMSERWSSNGRCSTRLENSGVVATVRILGRKRNNSSSCSYFQFETW